MPLRKFEVSAYGTWSSHIQWLQVFCNIWSKFPVLQIFIVGQAREQLEERIQMLPRRICPSTRTSEKSCPILSRLYYLTSHLRDSQTVCGKLGNRKGGGSKTEWERHLHHNWDTWIKLRHFCITVGLFFSVGQMDGKNQGLGNSGVPSEANWWVFMVHFLF